MLVRIAAGHLCRRQTNERRSIIEVVSRHLTGLRANARTADLFYWLRMIGRRTGCRKRPGSGPGHHSEMESPRGLRVRSV